MTRTAVRSAVLVRVCVVLLVLAGIGLPEVAHYWIWTPRYPKDIVEQLRSQPTDGELARMSVPSYERPEGTVDPLEAVRVAEQILRGEWLEPYFGARPVHLPFKRSDLDYGWPSQQLNFASLGHVNALLTAYDSSFDTRFLAAARDAINAWARYERRAMLPRGYLWNDHAIAQRLLVLSRYWRAIRRSNVYDEVSGRLLVEFVGRSGRLLATPSHFTVRTNHGVMQNLALLHVAGSFPSLPDSAELRRIAIERLKLQLRFYQSEEGVILEHSASYHAFGVTLLALLHKYRELLDENLSRDIDARLAKACAVYRQLLRPDRSLPLIGNTSAGPFDAPCDDVKDGSLGADLHDGHLSTYPVSGYAIAWSASRGGSDSGIAPSQTVVTWSSFATEAHKHDDEMAIATWSQGGPILTGAGYWPYGHPLQGAANSWRGNNAPHFEVEANRVNRRTALLGQASSRELSAVDLVRINSGGVASLRRQVVMLGPETWLVLDYARSRASQPVSTVWTLFPGWTVQTDVRGAVVRARDAEGKRRLNGTFVSSGKIEIREWIGSSRPFGGWVATEFSPESIRKAASIEVRAEPDVPVVTVWTLAQSANVSSGTIQSWAGPDNWVYCLDAGSCDSRVMRRGSAISAVNGSATQTIALRPVADTTAAVREINDRYREATRQYPYWKDLTPWRARASWWLVILFAAQEIVFLVLSRIRAVPSLWSRRAHIGAVGAWVVVGALIVFAYLRP